MSNNNLDDMYRQVIMDHYKSPRNKGIIDGEHMKIELNNPSCGDRITLTLKVEDGIVVDSKFDGEGCSISMSSASMMTVAIIGKKVEEALKYIQAFSDLMHGKEIDENLELEDIEALSGVCKFPARIKCAMLAWEALSQGLLTDEGSSQSADKN